MTKTAQLNLMKDRCKVLAARGRANGRIIRKLERRIRSLESEM